MGFYQFNLSDNQGVLYQIEIIEDRDAPNFHVEGRPCRVQIQTNSPYVEFARERLAQHSQMENLSLKEILAEVVNIDEEQIHFEELPPTLKAIDERVQQVNEEDQKIIDDFSRTFQASVRRNQAENADNAARAANASVDKIRQIKYSEQHRIVKLVKSHRANKNLTKKRVELIKERMKLYQTVAADHPKRRHLALQILEGAILTNRLDYLDRMLAEVPGKELPGGLLFLAVSVDSPEIIKRLVQAGIDVETHTKDDKESLLGLACLRGEEQAVRTLLELGAKPEGIPGNTAITTPAHRAFSSRLSLQTTSLLLDHLEEINIRSPDGGRSLLHEAVYHVEYEKGIKKVALLLKKNIDVNAQDDAGNSALHIAAKIKNQWTISLMEKLLEAEADPNLRDNLGRSALHFAAAPKREKEKGLHGRGVKLLLQHKADVHAQDLNGNSPLHAAMGRFETGGDNAANIKALIEAGADVDAQNNEGNTPLHLAVMRENIGMVRLLLKAGANPMIPNQKNLLPGGMFGETAVTDKNKIEAILNLLARP